MHCLINNIISSFCLIWCMYEVLGSVASISVWFGWTVTSSNPWLLMPIRFILCFGTTVVWWTLRWSEDSSHTSRLPVWTKRHLKFCCLSFFKATFSKYTSTPHALTKTIISTVSTLIYALTLLAMYFFIHKGFLHFFFLFNTLIVISYGHGHLQIKCNEIDKQLVGF